MQITAQNTNDLQAKVYPLIRDHGVPVNTRNGPALRMPGVTTITLEKPWQRVNFSAVRDANPFFHLIESCAMLAGQVGNNVALLSYFAKNMLLFTDDGQTYNAFYGSRSRHTFGDQVAGVVKELQANPESRQAVINLWDPDDLWYYTKDKACNLCMIFDVQDGKLCMTTFNRSNDAIWGGVTGANVVLLSFFQEYVACALGLQMGPWNHSSANLHVYLNNPKWPAIADDTSPLPEVYEEGGWLFQDKDWTKFDSTLHSFIGDLTEAVLDHPPMTMVADLFDNWFIDRVALPYSMAYMAWKQGKKQLAYSLLWQVRSPDWRLAGLLWFKRREGIILNPNNKPHINASEFNY